MRSKLLAVLGATVLSVGVVGVALAVDLKDPHVGTTVTWDENGDPQVSGSDFEGGVNTDEGCDALDLGPGEVFFHFVQSPTDAEHGKITVDFGSDGSVGPQDEAQNGGSHLAWDVNVTDDGDGSVEVVGASTDQDGGELKISHICAGPAFEQTEEPNTDAPTEPNTAELGATGTSGPADGAWLLVVALGVLLASIVVLTPARAKSRR